MNSDITTTLGFELPWTIRLWLCISGLHKQSFMLANIWNYQYTIINI